MVLRPAAMAGDGALEGKHYGDILNRVACARATLGTARSGVGDATKEEPEDRTSIRRVAP